MKLYIDVRKLFRTSGSGFNEFCSWVLLAGLKVCLEQVNQPPFELRTIAKGLENRVLM